MPSASSHLLLILSLALLAIPCHAEITRWIDKDGHVHYSDQPPSSGAQKIQQLNIHSSPAQSPDTSWEQKDLELRKRLQQSEDAQKKADEEKKALETKKHNCISARSNLLTLQNSGRIMRYNAAGEREYLDDTARAAAIDEAKQAVDSWCQ